ncbi:PlsC domain-containing protein [Aphelenchoides fujianensis]|nr:PlsC domain-containing protein [Aphelenchoides fujianensis]
MISPDEYVNWLQLKCIKAVAIESNRSEKEVHAEAKAIMDNMAHSFNLPSTKAVGYLVLKCLRRLLDKVMVNMEALRKIRKLSHNNPVVFMPTHRTYVDFLLISLLCYDQDLRLPAICAGADFLTSKFVGEALRRCGAFFIRRSFGSDRLYWTLFTEYVQSHIVHNEAPIEFFVEGQRSRTSKSLYPKFGLVQVIAEPFLRSQVYDTLVVPVTINYDRLLESFLYGRELLGAPKPKENGLRSPTAHYIYERNVKKTVATLAHEVVHVQNKQTILTLWPLAASAIQAELRAKGHVNHGDLIEKVAEIYYLQLYADLFEVDGERLKLKAADVNRSTDLPEDVLQDAIPNVVLHNAVNPLAYLLSDFGFVLIVCREQTEYTHVEREFTFLRTVFEKEFVQKPNSASEDLRVVVDVLVNAGLLERNGDELPIRDLQAASVPHETD